MVVIVMQNVHESLRGEITRYMLELKAGVFIGQLNARATELLWEKIEKNVGEGGALIARNDASEQGYSLRFTGHSDRVLEDFDGLTLVSYKKAP